MQLLDGKLASARIREDAAQRVQTLKTQGITPGLGTILVGDDAASAVYIGAKHRACEEVGVRSIHAHLPANTTQAELLAQINAFNQNPEVHSYIVQLPLPRGLNEEAALLAIDPRKDADGLHPVNLGKLVMGAAGPLPCTPAGIVELLRQNDVPVEGRHVVIVGRGLTVGRPLALLLALKRPGCNAAVTVVHTGVADMAFYTRQANVLVVGVGVPNLIKPDMVRVGAAIVGAGISRDENNKIVSDIDESVASVAGWMTPRVGGVGPMTVAMLIQQTVAAAEKRRADS